jgi:hypothetical protein
VWEGIINTEKSFAMPYHTKQVRVTLKLQIAFQTIKITYQSELEFLRIYTKENIKWGAYAPYYEPSYAK